VLPVGFALVLVGYSGLYLSWWRFKGDRRTVPNILKGVGAPIIRSTDPAAPGSPLLPGGSTYGSQVPKYTPTVKPPYQDTTGRGSGGRKPT
jgi:hypothetical protein